MKNLAVAAAMLMATTVAQAQVYKCHQGDQIVYSDAPCAEDGKPMEVAPARGHDPATARRLKEEQARQRAEQAQRREAAAKARQAESEARWSKLDAARDAEIAKQVELAKKSAAPAANIDWTPCGDRSMAYVMSQRGVKGQLRAPSTAEFPSQPVAAEYIGDCKWAVVGDVDAQNASGAMLRNRYSVTMEYEPAGNTWRAHNVNITPAR